MTEIDDCAVEGCGRRFHARGVCKKHYARLMRNGSPVSGRTENGKGKEFIERSLASHSEECTVWPYYKKSGYGAIKSKGKHVFVHRIVCEKVNGPPPTKGHHAAHTCGNRACINPLHIRWATPIENERDKIRHGTSNRGSGNGRAKLQEHQVRLIRSMEKCEPTSVTAKRFGVSARTILEIQSGSKWGWLP